MVLVYVGKLLRSVVKIVRSGVRDGSDVNIGRVLRRAVRILCTGVGVSGGDGGGGDKSVVGVSARVPGRVV